MSTIDKKTVGKIAGLARLSLTSEEESAALRYMEDVLEYADLLSDVKTEGVDMFVSHTTTLKHLRDDAPRMYENVDALITEKNFLKNRYLETGSILESDSHDD